MTYTQQFFYLFWVNLTWGIDWWCQNFRFHVPKDPKWENYPFFGLEFRKFKKIWKFVFFLLMTFLSSVECHFESCLYSKGESTKKFWNSELHGTPKNFAPPLHPHGWVPGPNFLPWLNNSLGPYYTPKRKRNGDVMVPPLVRLWQNAPLVKEKVSWSTAPCRILMKSVTRANFGGSKIKIEILASIFFLMAR